MSNSLVKNQIVEVTIEDITTDGNGVGRYNNTVIFVPMTTIGDIINCRIVNMNILIASMNLC
ncbi:MAG: TRAM domain-containing protein [Ruminococcus sp.]|nr:TRAM domain-containing protein [Ruminococcus sp.]